MTIISTAETTTEPIGLNANHIVLFVPNKLSMPNLLVNDEQHSDFFDFCCNYFFGNSIGYKEIKPFAYAGLMLEEIEEDEWGCYEYASEDEYTTYTSPAEWLSEVIANFGPDTIIICSDYC